MDEQNNTSETGSKICPMRNLNCCEDKCAWWTTLHSYTQSGMDIINRSGCALSLIATSIHLKK